MRGKSTPLPPHPVLLPKPPSGRHNPHGEGTQGLLAGGWSDKHMFQTEWRTTLEIEKRHAKKAPDAVLKRDCAKARSHLVLNMRLISKGLLYFLTFGVAGYAAFAYGVMPLGSLVHPDMKAGFLTHSAGIYTHVFASIIALVLGPFQFSARLRRKHTDLHRWFGRAYLAMGVLLGGLSGLYLSQYAFGGPMARLGFATLALFWVYTGLCAYLAVRRGAIDEHRKWMVRNFSLTIAAVT